MFGEVGNCRTKAVHRPPVLSGGVGVAVVHGALLLASAACRRRDCVLPTLLGVSQCLLRVSQCDIEVVSSPLGPWLRPPFRKPL